MVKYFLASLFLIHSVATACPQPVRPIKTGEVVECDGFLFSDEAEKRAAEARDNVEYYKKLNLKLEERNGLADKENDILKRRLNELVTISNELSKDKARRDNSENLYRILYFTLGAGLTAYIASNVRR